MIVDILFLLLGLGLLAGAVLVMAAHNPMVGVLGMLLAFVNAAGLFILMGAEFLGLLIIMVYMGAIMVMFLFVVMTIDIDFAKLREEWSHHLPLGVLVVVALVAELVLAAMHSPAVALVAPAEGPQNIMRLGQVLFTTYAIPFQTAGLVLLVAMVGAIVLTHRPPSHVLRQSVPAQIRRAKKDVLALVKPKVGAGIGTGDVAKHWNPQSVAKKLKKG